MTDQSQPWHIAFTHDRWCLRQVSVDGGSHEMGFATREEAEAEYARLEAVGRCVECNDVLYDHWFDDVKQQVLTRKLCHTCLFWTDYVETRTDPTHAVVGGRHYVYKADTPDGFRGFVGHGGAEFAFIFTDGRRVVSRNVWAQGTVPTWFRDRLPDNAVFEARGRRAIGPFAGYGGAGSADAACEPPPAGDAVDPQVTN
jgi:hypothetical protein